MVDFGTDGGTHSATGTRSVAPFTVRDVCLAVLSEVFSTAKSKSNDVVKSRRTAMRAELDKLVEAQSGQTALNIGLESRRSV